MKIVDLDYYATCGNSWIHKLSPKVKLLFTLLVLVLVVTATKYYILAFVYLLLLMIILLSKVQRAKIIAASFYPMLFLVIYVISLKNLNINYFLLMMFKVLSASTAFVLLVFTTTYIQIFHNLERFLPTFLVSALFLTYRSIFILWTIVENIEQAMYIRGNPKLSRPIYSIKILSNALGYLIITAIELSEKMYDALKLRGYSGNLRYLKKVK